MTVCCKKCSWGQDDFWDETYNPFKCAAGDEKEFLKTLEKAPTERVLAMDIGWLRETGMKGTPHGGLYLVSEKDMAIYRFQQLLNRVRNMKWWTYADFNNDPNPTCPVCGSNLLSVD